MESGKLPERRGEKLRLSVPLGPRAAKSARAGSAIAQGGALGSRKGLDAQLGCLLTPV